MKNVITSIKNKQTIKWIKSNVLWIVDFRATLCLYVFKPT